MLAGIKQSKNLMQRRPRCSNYQTGTLNNCVINVSLVQKEDKKHEGLSTDMETIIRVTIHTFYFYSSGYFL